MNERILIWRRRFHFKERTQRLKGVGVTLLKCVILLIAPAIIAGLADTLWYFCAWRRGMHFEDRMEVMVVGGCILISGVVYALMLQTAFQAVWEDYRAMRTAIKRYDVDTFMELVDENLSPLMHTVALASSALLLLGFMAFKYPDARSGLIVVYAISFLLALMLIIILEIDDPTAGLWFIQNIPAEWLEIDSRDYRRLKNQQAHDKFCSRDHWYFKQCAEEPPSAAVPATEAPPAPKPPREHEAAIVA